MNYEDLTTDQLLEVLPHHLHVARNDNAESHDRWRIYNMSSGKYVEPGKAVVRELLISTLEHIALAEGIDVDDSLECLSVLEQRAKIQSAIDDATVENILLSPIKH